MHYQIDMPGNKENCITPVPDEKITSALRVILDRRNHPMLIHCNKGKVGSRCGLNAPLRSKLTASAAPNWNGRWMSPQVPSVVPRARSG